jgi:hypothetical protein
VKTNRYNSIDSNSLTGACPGVFSAGNDAGNLTTDKDGQAKPVVRGREYAGNSYKNYIWQNRQNTTTCKKGCYDENPSKKGAVPLNLFSWIVKRYKQTRMSLMRINLFLEKALKNEKK